MVRVGVRWKAVGPSNFQLDDYLMPLAEVSIWDIQLTGSDCLRARNRGRAFGPRQTGWPHKQLDDA